MQFDLLIQFITQEWLLVLALAATLTMLFLHEKRKAGPAVSCQQAINMVNSEEGVFLDIRDGAEFKKSHIVDAVHVPLTKLAGRVGELEKYQEKPVIVVCKLGQSAGSATKTLRGLGFTRAHKMSGGMMEWQAQKLPVVSE
ncbi:rhodanese domain protein [Luminiphilus syltensis NOR5-1B]|uniref:Rhodanese domain protein n=1 Tax=Luminiphilus syltensis NOR5-1B TaxID=565045 RepID=B8KUP7_9GAMM|nr:rhodanese domain protein [Luminiphilus syltensis NOR5-1B]